jgi:hypothetical protein
VNPVVGLLVAVCPADPIDNFIQWLFCAGLSTLGIHFNDDGTGGMDLVANLLMGTGGGTGGDCTSLLEPLLGHGCLTHTMWQMTEVAGYPLIALTIGTRFMKMLVDNNFGSSPGWAIADPLLRAVVAAAGVHLSFPVMAAAHGMSEQLGMTIYSHLASSGGINPTAGLLGTAGGGGGLNPLVWIIQWLYTVYVFVLILASLVGYQICMILAPLVIPLWVHSGQNSLFMWFAKTAGGALILPVIVGVGWGAIVAMTHQLDITSAESVWLPMKMIAATTIELVFIAAGVWFMGGFIKGTTGELFGSRGVLGTLFLAEATLLMTTRMAGAAMPQGAAYAATRKFAGLMSKGWMPRGLARMAHNVSSEQIGRVMQLTSLLETDGAARRIVARFMGPQIGQFTKVMRDSIAADIVNGNVHTAAQKAAWFNKENWEQLSWQAYRQMPIQEKWKLAEQMWSYMSNTGLGNSQLKAMEDQGRAALWHYGVNSPAGREINEMGRELGRRIHPAQPPTPMPPPRPANAGRFR